MIFNTNNNVNCVNTKMYDFSDIIETYVYVFIITTSFLYTIKICIRKMIMNNKSIYKYFLIFYKIICVFLSMFCTSGLLILCQVGGLLAILNILCIIYIFCITGFFITNNNKDGKHTKILIILVFLSHIYGFTILYFTSTTDNTASLYDHLKYYMIISVGFLPSLPTSYLFFYILVGNLPSDVRMITVNNSELIDDCPICLEVLSIKETVILECNHYFHKECIEQSLKYNNKCPICRNTLEVSNV